MNHPIPFKKVLLGSFAACIITLAVGGSAYYATRSADAKPLATTQSESSQEAQPAVPSVIVSTCPASSIMHEVDIPSTDIPIGSGMDIDLGLGYGAGSGMGTENPEENQADDSYQGK